MTIFDKDYGNTRFDDNQIGDMLQIVVTKRSIDIPNGTKWNVSG